MEKRSKRGKEMNESEQNGAQERNEKNEARRKVFLRYSWFLAQKKML